MTFFAKELQRFNNKEARPVAISNEHHPYEPSDQSTRAKRRRRNDGEPSPVSFIDTSPALPDEESLQIVLQAYFSHIHPWIPIIHEGRFRRRLAESSELEAINVVLHSIILAASRYVNDEDVAISVYGSPQHRALIRDWIVSNAMKDLSVESLQALIIVSFNDVCGSGFPFCISR